MVLCVLLMAAVLKAPLLHSPTRCPVPQHAIATAAVSKHWGLGAAVKLCTSHYFFKMCCVVAEAEHCGLSFCRLCVLRNTERAD